MIEGENFVSLKGYIQQSTLKTVGNNNSILFKGKFAIPINNKKQYIKIGAWNAIAEGLGELSKNSFIYIHGHIEESSYDGKCRYCNGAEKKYWTEVIIDNFVVIE
jgi:hypothetical protein